MGCDGRNRAIAHVNLSCAGDPCDGGCDGDTDGDGTVSVGDLINVITLWGTDGEAPGISADVDGSGEVGVGDLILVITGWGDCP